MAIEKDCSDCYRSHDAAKIKTEVDGRDGTIKSVNNAKYLGITLDNRFNFHEHIKITETKVARSVGILSKLKYYLPESAMLQLYYSLVHSQLIYVVAVWGFNTFPSYLAKLTGLQNKALRLV